MFDKDCNVLFLAYFDNVPVGYVFGNIKYKLGKFVYNSVAHIDALYVLDAYRNNGIATSLMNAFYDLCRGNEIKFIEVEVFKNNTDAYHLYSNQ